MNGLQGSSIMADKFEDEAASIVKQAAPRRMELSAALATYRLQDMIANALQAAEARGYYKALRDAKGTVPKKVRA